jgi:aquaporin Z
MVSAAAPLTYGHFNPAVSLAIWARGRLKLSSLIIYCLAQLLGGFIGAGVSRFWLGGVHFDCNFPSPFKGINTREDQAFAVEFAFALMIILSYLHATTTEANKTNQYFGLAIGFAMLSGREAAGPYSGGIFNPAVASGLYAASRDAVSEAERNLLWIYWIAPLFAAGVSVVLFLLMAPNEFSRTVPRYILVIARDWNLAKYFTEFICTFFLTISAVLGNGGTVVAARRVPRGGWVAVSRLCRCCVVVVLLLCLLCTVRGCLVHSHGSLLHRLHSDLHRVHGWLHFGCTLQPRPDDWRLRSRPDERSRVRHVHGVPVLGCHCGHWHRPRCHGQGNRL